jgi:hypothetical protein
MKHNINSANLSMIALFLLASSPFHANAQSQQLLTVSPPMLSGSGDNGPFANPIPYGIAENTDSDGWSWGVNDYMVVDFQVPVAVNSFRAYSSDPTDPSGATWAIQYSSDDINWTTISSFNFTTSAGVGVNDDGSSRSDLAGWYAVSNFNGSFSITARYWQVIETAVTGAQAPVVSQVQFYGVVPGAARPIMSFVADDPGIVTNLNGGTAYVSVWPDESGFTNNALSEVPFPGYAPILTNAMVNGVTRSVIRFPGTGYTDDVLQAPVMCTPSGTLLIVMETSNPTLANQRVVGWADSDVGDNGLDLSPNLSSTLYAIMRDNGTNGDIPVEPADPNTTYELITVTWGAAGGNVYRNGTLVGSRVGLTALSADPNITALSIGGTGSGTGGAYYQGDVLALVVYDQQLDGSALAAAEAPIVTNFVLGTLPTLVTEFPTGEFGYPASVPAIQITLQDGTTAVATGTIQLTVNGHTETPTITQNSGVTTLTTISDQAPLGDLVAGTNTVQIIYGNNAFTTVYQTNDFTFAIGGAAGLEQLLTVSPPMLSGSGDIGPFANPAPYGDGENTSSVGWSWINNENVEVNFQVPTVVSEFRAYSTDPTDPSGATWEIQYSSDNSNWTTMTNFNFTTFAGGGVNDDGSSRSDLAGWYQTTFNTNGGISAQYWQVVETAVTGAQAPVVGPVQFIGAQGTPHPVMAFYANEPGIITNGLGQVTLWPDTSMFTNNAVSVGSPNSTLTTVSVNGVNQPAILFNGVVSDYLQAPVMCTPSGSFFIAMKRTGATPNGQRVVGWEAAGTGHDGFGLGPNLVGGTAVDAIMRNDGVAGDVDATPSNFANFEVISATWGAAGCRLYRGGVLVASNTTITSISTSLTSGSIISGLNIGGSGSPGGNPYTGYVLALVVYDQQLDDAARSAVETEMLNQQLSIIPPLTIVRGAGSTVTLSWIGSGVLQSAPGISGPWFDVGGAASPYTTAVSGPPVFFRLRND